MTSNLNNDRTSIQDSFQSTQQPEIQPCENKEYDGSQGFWDHLYTKKHSLEVQFTTVAQNVSASFRERLTHVNDWAEELRHFGL